MNLTDFSKGQIWSILPNELAAMMQVAHEFHGDSKQIAMEAAKFNKRRTEHGGYRSKGGVAVIPIVGPISKRETLFSLFFGGTSTASISNSLSDALEDPDVEAIVLDIDSPGGTVSGTGALAEKTFESRKLKPIVAFANGMMASAAYWIGSAANSIIAEATADIGSIGVIMVHYDLSEWDKQLGVKRTFLSAGKYKALGNSAEPLGQIAREVFESELDYIYSLFVETVARNRAKGVQTVIKNMADGRIFIGQQAVEAGLVDRIGNLGDAVSMAAALAQNKVTGVKPVSAALPSLSTQIQTQIGGKLMNDENEKDFLTLVEDHQLLHKCKKVAAMQAVMAKNPESHLLYLESVNPGKKFARKE